MSEVTALCDRPVGTQEEWERRVRAVLKGAAFETLHSMTADGICIEPLYAAATGQAVPGRSAGSRWSVVQRVDHPEPAAARELAAQDVANGATGLTLSFRGATSARGFGLKEPNARSIAFALKDLPLHQLHIRLEAGEKGAEAAEALRQVIVARSFNPERMSLSFGMDPIGAMAIQGGLDAPLDAMMSRVGATALSLRQEFAGPFVEADGRIHHDGGASEAQEVGASLATAVAYLRLLEGKLDEAAAARAVGVTLSADADIFMNLAKFRAARLLWQHLAQTCGMVRAPLRLHAETSWRMMTATDPHGNLLRNVAAVFAAGAGGADSICCLPFSLAQGLPDNFARRMARNVQTILLEESQIHLVGDPAEGSGYVEALTRALCEKAWAFFQDIERQGGMVPALKIGFIQEQLRKTQLLRELDLREGRRSLIGVTAYQPSAAAPASVLDISREPAVVRDAIAPLLARREAEDFEKQTVR